jgi:peroxiredoxin
MQCRSLSAQFGRHYQDFQSANTQVIVILGDDIDRARKYSNEMKLPFPVLADPERQVYHRYGLHKAFVLIQRSAAVIIDQEGVIQFIKVVTNPLSWLAEYEELYQEVLRNNVNTSQK